MDPKRVNEFGTTGEDAGLEGGSATGAVAALPDGASAGDGGSSRRDSSNVASSASDDSKKIKKD